MKKLLCIAVLVSILGVVSCKNDDDNKENCRDCNFEGIPYRICDNGDGTLTVTASGIMQTITLDEGVSFDQYADGICSGIINPLSYLEP